MMLSDGSTSTEKTRALTEVNNSQVKAGLSNPEAKRKGNYKFSGADSRLVEDMRECRKKTHTLDQS